MDGKKVIKDLLPPVVLKIIRNVRKNTGAFGFTGRFESWDAAAAACKTEGYAEQDILKKTLKSVLAVKNGDAVFERDSVLFDEIQYSWPLLSAILLAAAEVKDELRVLDFGGSLGSTYFQNKKFLEVLPHKVSYGVVEQAHYIDVGNEKIADNKLCFFKSIEDYTAVLGGPHIVVLSGVLQNVNNYDQILQDVLSKNIKFICVDRTPFVSRGGEAIMIQNVFEPIYTARYPHRFFEKSKFLSIFTNYGYEALESFDAIDDSNEFATWEGFIFIKKTDN